MKVKSHEPNDTPATAARTNAQLLWWVVMCIGDNNISRTNVHQLTVDDTSIDTKTHDVNNIWTDQHQLATDWHNSPVNTAARRKLVQVLWDYYPSMTKHIHHDPPHWLTDLTLVEVSILSGLGSTTATDYHVRQIHWFCVKYWPREKGCCNYLGFGVGLVMKWPLKFIIWPMSG